MLRCCHGMCPTCSTPFSVWMSWRKKPLRPVVLRRYAIRIKAARFTSDAFTGALKRHDIRIGMDGKGRWVDNVYLRGACGAVWSTRRSASRPAIVYHLTGGRQIAFIMHPLPGWRLDPRLHLSRGPVFRVHFFRRLFSETCRSSNRTRQEMQQ